MKVIKMIYFIKYCQRKQNNKKKIKPFINNKPIERKLHIELNCEEKDYVYINNGESLMHTNDQKNKNQTEPLNFSSIKNGFHIISKSNSPIKKNKILLTSFPHKIVINY